MTTYKLHTVQLHADGMGAAVNLPAITNQNLSLNPNIVAEITAGKVSPAHIAFNGITPDFTFATRNIGTALDEIGVRGLDVDSDTNVGVKAFLAKYDEFGSVASGSVHRQHQIRKCVVIPIAITADHQGDALLECRIVIIQKSSAILPVILADNVALPTVSVAEVRYTLGDISIGGNTLTKFRSLRLDFGNEVTVSGTQSEIYPEHVEVRTQGGAQLTLTGIDPTWYSTFAIGGDVAAHADTLIYLRKRAQTGSHYVADLTAEHIEITMAGLVSITEGLSGPDATTPTEHSLIVQGAEDASGNVPIIIDTAHAHPT